MELDEELPLLGPGDAPTLQAWEAAAAAVLRKAGRMSADEGDGAARTRLEHTTVDGILVPALATSADVAGLPPVGLPGTPPYTRGGVGLGTSGWDIRAVITEPDRDEAAAAATTDLRHGANSLWVEVGNTGTRVGDLDAVLADVHLDAAAVVIDADPTVDPVDAARAFATVLDDRAEPPHPHTSLGVDPLARLARWGRLGDSGDESASDAGTAMVEEAVDRAVAAAAQLAAPRGVRAIVVDATVVHDAGGSDAQELGYALAAGTRYLRSLERAGLSPAESAGLIEFRFAATDEQFLTIAKLRAARRLWHRATELARFPAEYRGQRQHVVTSRAMITRYDPWVNMLRGTVAAFAAGVAGVDAVTVLPFDHGLGRPDALARRIARNTSSVLIHESQLARVADPAGGSYAVEVLTDRVSRAGWAAFQQLEAPGGLVASLHSGELADRVAQTWQQRRAQLASRERPVTGVSEFPLAGEVLPKRAPWPDRPSVSADTALTAVTYAAEFEALRDDPVPVPAFVATLGPVAFHTTRATYATNLLTAGGVPAVVAGATSGVDDLVAAYRANSSPVVVLAGADADYDDWGPEAADALREAGATWLVCVGRPGAGWASAVDDVAAPGTDAVAVLTEIRRHLRASKDGQGPSQDDRRQEGQAR